MCLVGLNIRVLLVLPSVALVVSLERMDRGICCGRTGAGKTKTTPGRQACGVLCTLYYVPGGRKLRTVLGTTPKCRNVSASVGWTKHISHHQYTHTTQHDHPSHHHHPSSPSARLAPRRNAPSQQHHPRHRFRPIATAGNNKDVTLVQLQTSSRALWTVSRRQNARTINASVWSPVLGAGTYSMLRYMTCADDVGLQLPIATLKRGS